MRPLRDTHTLPFRAAKRPLERIPETWYTMATSSSTIEPVESTILARVIAADALPFPSVVASELLKWGFPEADKQRMTELAAKAWRGTLTAEEQVETEGYERVSSFLGLVKSKARRSLQNTPGPVSDGSPSP